MQAVNRLALRRIGALLLRNAQQDAATRPLQTASSYDETRDTMPTAPRPFRTRCSPDPASLCARAVAARLNPLLNVILAFWAQFHCRHARPPALARLIG
ncbi:hypothetical protein [Paraburkholderia bannensis]|uniref:hypothetical protein n=2 Tax=Paraburkholderia bannensis TaxID=765414 RepID=UPI002ABDB03F|nr:hypothetical protein [Paraburkholderia bannensis]